MFIVYIYLTLKSLTHFAILTHTHHHHGTLEPFETVTLETPRQIDTSSVSTRVHSDHAFVNVRAVGSVGVDGETGVADAHEAAQGVPVDGGT